MWGSLLPHMRSEIIFSCRYEEDPEKARQAREAFEHGLRYVAKQGGWLQVLEERDAAIGRLKELSEKLLSKRTE